MLVMLDALLLIAYDPACQLMGGAMVATLCGIVRFERGDYDT